MFRQSSEDFNQLFGECAEPGMMLGARRLWVEAQALVKSDGLYQCCTAGQREAREPGGEWGAGWAGAEGLFRVRF